MGMFDRPGDDNALLMWAGVGAVAALGFLGLTRSSRSVKPAMRIAIKEGYAFKEWLLTRAEHVRADLADAAAEAHHDHAQERDLEQLLNTLAADHDLLAKVEALIRSKRKTRAAETERPRPKQAVRKSRRQRSQRSE